MATLGLATMVFGTGCPKGECGDGVLDNGEQCDDGNVTGGDGCSATCQIETGPVCGDNVMDPGEGCDDGNNTDGDGCSSLCQIEPMDCGDGTCDMAGGETCTNCVLDCATDPLCINPVENCTNGIDDDGDGDIDCADSDCTLDPACGGVGCGDGIVQVGEQCDDGNTVAGDGCSPTCQFEALACPVPASVNCGDVVMDDVNMNGSSNVGQWACFGWATDGPEMGYELTSATTRPVDLTLSMPVGDMDLAVIEDNGAGCDPNGCTGLSGNVGNMDETVSFIALAGVTYYIIVDTYIGDMPPMPGGAFTLDVACGAPVICGDGAIGAGETCDDGNTTAGDGCSDLCQIETLYSCVGEPSVCTFTCGDGAIDNTGEECDDGNLTAGDGCSDLCAREMGYLCQGEPSVCNPVVVLMSSPAAAIPDGDPAGITDTVTGTTDCFIVDLAFEVDINHDWAGDVTLTVTNDTAGITVGILNQPGVPESQYGTEDDLAGTYVFQDGGVAFPIATMGPPIPNGPVYAPEGPGALADLLGTNLNDQWTVFVSDAIMPDPGTLNSWSLLAVCGTAPVCGDSVLGFGEGCDDGNATAGDGCDASCQVETLYNCVGEPSVCTFTCGDGQVDYAAGEACDDGGVATGDGCDDLCQTEAGFLCFGVPSDCNTAEVVMGSGFAIPDNAPAGAIGIGIGTTSCSITGLVVEVDMDHTWIGDVVLELNNVTTGTTVRLLDQPGALITPPFGNTDAVMGVYTFLEGATPFPAIAGSGTVPPGTYGISGPGSLGDFLGASPDDTWTLFASDNAMGDTGMVNSWSVMAVCGTPPVCGDGILAFGEGCDDGNTTTGDGCDDLCDPEPGYVCVGGPSICTFVCGDGVIDIGAGEACDDGNNTTGDGCDDVCQVEGGFACFGEPSVCGMAISGSSSPALAIPDNTPAGVTDMLMITDVCTIVAIDVDVDITHTYIGDLIVELTSPGGTLVTLHAMAGGGADDIVGNYPLTLTPVMPLTALAGQSAMGSWSLHVSDNLGADTGTLNSWGVNIICQ